jgi:hypothetical protein
MTTALTATTTAVTVAVATAVLLHKASCLNVHHVATPSCSRALTVTARVTM